MATFEWDERKARANLENHGIDFADAATALNDDLAILIHDEHDDEDRFVTIGEDLMGRLLVVVFTMRGERIRIISARTASPREAEDYSRGQ